MGLNKSVVKAYVRSGGSYCPHCGSRNIVGGTSDFDGGVVTASVKCEDCNKYWTDVYKLVNIDD